VELLVLKKLFATSLPKPQTVLQESRTVSAVVRMEVSEGDGFGQFGVIVGYPAPLATPLPRMSTG
jgi:hypothetical protein